MKKRSALRLSIVKKTIAQLDLNIRGGVELIDPSAKCTMPTSCCPTTHDDLITLECTR
ncbi:hypothetical protein ACJD0Z_00395 [Flavobacteriaceae bacterium M23B6Z8]